MFIETSGCGTRLQKVSERPPFPTVKGHLNNYGSAVMRLQSTTLVYRGNLGEKALGLLNQNRTIHNDTYGEPS